MVCKDEELASFQHEAKVVDGGVDSQQLPVKAALQFLPLQFPWAVDQRQGRLHLSARRPKVEW